MVQGLVAEGRPGNQLGRYRIESELGRGAMGVVYEARDTLLGRVVAVKILSDGLAGDPRQMTRLLGEARLLAALHHPNIATIHGAGRSDDGIGYLVLERVQGESLDVRLSRGPLAPERALDVCRQIVRALRAAHERDIVHCDLKPANVMLTPDGLIKVLDFGLARRAIEPVRRGPITGSASEPPPGHSQVSSIAGTPGYMSPEQLMGEHPEPPTDVFAFGCVLFECLTGKRAFPGHSMWAVIAATLDLDPDWTALPNAVPEPVVRLLRACLAKAQDRRPDVNGLESVFATAVAAPHHNLPEPSTRFVGREQQIRECVEVAEHSRLLTLTGTGGCGKTRLGIQIARAMLARHPDGVWFVDLAAIGAADRVVDAVARVVGVSKDMEGSLLEALVRRLADLRTLLVLDNCEHVLSTVRELVETLLARCPSLRLLATSREWFGVLGEVNYRVPSMSLPPEDLDSRRAAIESEAVALFVERVAQARPDPPLHDRLMPTVVRICRRLDGLPLAIELAASLAADHPLEDIEAQLASRVWGNADDPRMTPRERTIRGAIEWSLDRLRTEERRLLRGLAVFTGGCTLGGATAVCGDGRDLFEILDLLTGLVERSLVVMGWADVHESRYRLPEPVRLFALEELHASSEEALRRDLHLAYYLALAEEAAPELQGGDRQPLWVARLEAEHENLFAALDHCAHTTGGTANALRLAASCWRFWFFRGHFDVGRRALTSALEGVTGEDSSERAEALFGAAALASFQGDIEGGERLGHEALALYEGLGNRLGAAQVRVHLGVCAANQEQFDRARSIYHEALDLLRAAGATPGIAKTLNNLGVVARKQGDHRAAREYYQEALPLAREGQSQDTLAVVLTNLALASIRLDEVGTACDWIAECLALIKRTGSRQTAAAALEVSAEILAARGTHDRAASLYSAAAALRAAMHLPADTWWGAAHAEIVSKLRSELNAYRFDPAWTAGSAFTLHEAIDAATDWIRS